MNTSIPIIQIIRSNILLPTNILIILATIIASNIINRIVPSLSSDNLVNIPNKANNPNTSAVTKNISIKLFISKAINIVENVIPVTNEYSK